MLDLFLFLFSLIINVKFLYEFFDFEEVLGRLPCVVSGIWIMFPPDEILFLSLRGDPLRQILSTLSSIDYTSQYYGPSQDDYWGSVLTFLGIWLPNIDYIISWLYKIIQQSISSYSNAHNIKVCPHFFVPSATTEEGHLSCSTRLIMIPYASFTHSNA